MSQDDEARDPPTLPAAPVPPGSFVFGPRPVAVTSALIAVACLGTLVIVATQKNVDALSTIALALAILAFAAQLIIYIAQANNANQQLYLAQVVQAETARMLAGIQATADAQQGALDRIIPRLIRTTVAADTADEPESADPGELEKAHAQVEQLSERLEAIVREELAKAQPSYGVLLRGDPAQSIIRSDIRSYLGPVREANLRARLGETDPAVLKLDHARRKPSAFSKGTEDPSKLAEAPSSEPRPPTDSGQES